MVGLNTPVKSLEDFKQHNPTTCCLQEAHFKYDGICRLEGWKKVKHRNIKRNGESYNNVKYTRLQRTKNYQRQNGYYIVVKGSVHQKDLAVLNVCVSKQQSCKICEPKKN